MMEKPQIAQITQIRPFNLRNLRLGLFRMRDDER